MLVPSSFKYSARPPPRDGYSQQEQYAKMRLNRRNTRPAALETQSFDAYSASMHSQPTITRSPSLDFPPSPPSKPVSIPSRNSSTSRRSVESPKSTERSSSRRSRDSTRVHRQDALPPSVAALLAKTEIPPQRLTRRVPRPSSRRISIDELVQGWKQEAAAKPPIGSHKSMDVLLEDVSGDEQTDVDFTPSTRGSFSPTRSDSTDSVPSLGDADESSVISISNPPTPGHARTLRAPSISSAKKNRPRPLPAAEDSSYDHPLILTSPDPQFDALAALPLQQQLIDDAPRRQSFRSNLTMSFQTLKSRALQSLAQLHTTTSSAGTNPATQPYAFSDATLWSNPYMFPRLSPEIRPEPFNGTPTKSQRHYFNPTPLNFDEEQGYFRQALHTSLNLEGDNSERLTMIQMQTYSRNGKSAQATKSRKSKSANTSDPNSEAGRALASGGPPLMRQREPRENSHFLRVVVLEMNMRREGKLEETMPGRARIWLPPRQGGRLNENASPDSICLDEKRHGRQGREQHVPRRWRGVCADDIK